MFSRPKNNICTSIHARIVEQQKVTWWQREIMKGKQRRNRDITTRRCLVIWQVPYSCCGPEDFRLFPGSRVTASVTTKSPPMSCTLSTHRERVGERVVVEVWHCAGIVCHKGDIHRLFSICCGRSLLPHSSYLPPSYASTFNIFFFPIYFHYYPFLVFIRLNNLLQSFSLSIPQQ